MTDGSLARSARLFGLALISAVLAATGLAACTDAAGIPSAPASSQTETVPAPLVSTGRYAWADVGRRLGVSGIPFGFDVIKPPG